MKNEGGTRNARRKVLLGMAGVVALGVPMIVGVLTASRLRAQSSAVQAQTGVTDRPKFDAASVKVDKSADILQVVNVSLPGGRVAATNTLLRLIIAAAYQPGFAPRRSQATMFGLPDWDESEHFDIEAVAEGNATVEQKRLMLQSLLADRFKLVVHHEMRPLPIYALVVIKPGQLGPQLHAHSDDAKCSDTPVPIAAWTELSSPPLPPCGGLGVPSKFWGQNMITGASGNKITMEMLAARLSWFQDVDRTVIDRTGLNGLFDFAVEWTLQSPPPPPPGSQPSADASASDASGPPSIFTALQEELGLKLDRQTGPVDVLVIDHVEEPSPN